MQQESIFKSWVPNWAIIAILIFCMMHCMVVLGVYTSNSTYSASYLDVEPEDLQFTFSISYGVFLATIMIESRLFKFFPTKSYFLTIYSLMAICFMISGYTRNFSVFLILRIVEGVLMALPWLPLRQLLITRFTSKNAVIVGFSFNYGSLLVASPFIMTIVVWFLDAYEWRYMAYGAAVFQILCVVTVMVTFTNKRFTKKIPLYQIDWASYILSITAILSGCFVFIYGEKKYWFDSSEIIIGIIVTTIAGGLFLMRQLTMKRPALDLNIFRYRNLRIAIILFVILYISRATLNLVNSAMSVIWNWEPARVANVQYINVLGNVIGLVIAGVCLAKAVSVRKIFILGFSIFAVFHIWFTFLFLPDVSVMDIAIPYLLQGVAVGVLFVPMVLFTVSSVPTKYAPYSGLMGVAGRFWGSTIGFCIMQNAGVYLRQTHFTKLRQFVLSESPETQQRLATLTQSFLGKGYSQDDAYKLAVKQVIASVTKQSTLLANMEIFTWVGYFLLALALFLMFNNHLIKTVNIFKNRIWGS
ncbi:MAG: MFS transporter [Flavobacterium sp.]|nr:MFS transporter [Candidatus Neoflavobacterium equi]